MKLSDKILEQYKIEQNDICEKISLTMGIAESIGENLGSYVKAYKDALFMEGEIEKKEGLKVVGIDMGVAEGDISVEHTDSMKFTKSCKLCDGLLLLQSRRTSLSKDVEQRYMCRECGDITH